MVNIPDLANFYKNLPVLITGSSGFIGQHLVHKLRALSAQITTLTADIRDRQSVTRAIIGQKIIFHLAGHSGAVASNSDPLKDMHINCGGLLTLLEACRDFNSGVKVVFPSTRLVYGHPQYLPVAETHPTHPTSIYGIHKLTAENYLKLFADLYGLTTVSLRITNPYGPVKGLKKRSYGILNIFMQLALAGETITIYGDGKQLRDFIYIDDLINAMLIVGQSVQISNHVLNVSGEQIISLQEAANEIVSVIGRGRVEHVPWPTETQQVETGDFVADITKIKELTGWQPQIEFKVGLQQILDSE
ncbi:MAG TPA: NAD-dependent epimerase/dehydratase family protein [Anaerolineae bacterium]|nr:NAD-dependent epimerase/dehydratase family protein [Anaerolineae bacterium]